MENQDLPKVYQSGNVWQKKVYRHLAEYVKEKGVRNYGRSKGITRNGKSIEGSYYAHLLCEKDGFLNFISESIFRKALKRFDEHKAGDKERILSNTASSQAYCFNLFIFLDENMELADELFSALLAKEVKVQHIIPEFTPGKNENLIGFEFDSEIIDETIGDQGPNRGTDADVAVFYTDTNNQKGLILIEFKFIEAEFSVCTSYRTNQRNHPVCDSTLFYTHLVDNQAGPLKNGIRCGYKKYKNWPLTQASQLLDIKIIQSLAGCPFKYGLNQLWRNILLAERVSSARGCSEAHFWVFSPQSNDPFLWKNGETEKQLREILTEKGTNAFRKIYLESVLEKIEILIAGKSMQSEFREILRKYRV
jgi:hypothetical protein